MAISNKDRQALHAAKQKMQLELFQDTMERINAITSQGWKDGNLDAQRVERWAQIEEINAHFMERKKFIKALNFEEWRAMFP